MKMKFLLGLMLMVAINFMAAAQNRDQQTPEQRARMMTDKMTENLMLSESQREDVYEANLEMARVGNDRKAMMEAERRHDARMRDILDDDQYTSFRKDHDARSSKKNEETDAEDQSNTQRKRSR